MDKVFIEGLQIDALIGIYDWERRIRQPLRFDLELDFDNRRPAASDDIADTLDYKAVSKRLIAFVSASDYGLVETLAERCAELVLREFGVSNLRLKVSKPGAVRGALAVGVIIERSLADLPQDVPAAPSPGARETEASAPVPTSVPAAVAPETDAPVASGPGHPGAFATPPDMPAATEAAPVTASEAEAEAEANPARIADAPSRRDAVPPRSRLAARFSGATSRAYISLGSNIEPERNLRLAVAALRERFGKVLVSPVYRTEAVGFEGPHFLNAIAVINSNVHPFALNDWLHAQEIAQGRDRRDKSYSNRPLDMDIIYFGSLILDGPGDFHLPRAELHHAFVLKPLADVAPDFIDPIRNLPLARLWAAHPGHDRPPMRVEMEL